MQHITRPIHKGNVYATGKDTELLIHTDPDEHGTETESFITYLLHANETETIDTTQNIKTGVITVTISKFKHVQVKDNLFGTYTVNELEPYEKSITGVQEVPEEYRPYIHNFN